MLPHIYGNMKSRQKIGLILETPCVWQFFSLYSENSKHFEENTEKHCRKNSKYCGEVLPEFFFITSVNEPLSIPFLFNEIRLKIFVLILYMLTKHCSIQKLKE